MVRHGAAGAGGSPGVSLASTITSCGANGVAGGGASGRSGGSIGTCPGRLIARRYGSHACGRPVCTLISAPRASARMATSAAARTPPTSTAVAVPMPSGAMKMMEATLSTTAQAATGTVPSLPAIRLMPEKAAASTKKEMPAA